MSTHVPPTNQILVGDARTTLAHLPEQSIDTVITSPPYFRLRNYGHHTQIGLEQHVDQWVHELLLVTRGLKRVLKPTGSLWLNLGDTFARHHRDGVQPKSLVLAPERLALAMVKDGWILRNKIIWAKPNPMPTSVRDRLSCTWEVVYFFTTADQYYFDLDAIRVPHRSAKRQPKAAFPPHPASIRHQPAGTVHRPTAPTAARPQWSVPQQWRGPASGSNTGLDALKASGRAGHPLGKNPGDVWTLPTAGYRGAHHAVYPTTLLTRPMLATCPEKLCVGCGTPWTRSQSPASRQGSGSAPTLSLAGPLTKTCGCITAATRPGIVLDPFMGSGTTAIAAEQLGRQWIGIELNPAFAALAGERIDEEQRKRKANMVSAATAVHTSAVPRAA